MGCQKSKEQEMNEPKDLSLQPPKFKRTLTLKNKKLPKNAVHPAHFTDLNNAPELKRKKRGQASGEVKRVHYNGDEDNDEKLAYQTEEQFKQKQNQQQQMDQGFIEGVFSHNDLQIESSQQQQQQQQQQGSDNKDQQGYLQSESDKRKKTQRQKEPLRGNQLIYIADQINIHNNSMIINHSVEDNSSSTRTTTQNHNQTQNNMTFTINTTQENSMNNTLIYMQKVDISKQDNQDFTINEEDEEKNNNKNIILKKKSLNCANYSASTRAQRDSVKAQTSSPPPNPNSPQFKQSKMQIEQISSNQSSNSNVNQDQYLKPEGKDNLWAAEGVPGGGTFSVLKLDDENVKERLNSQENCIDASNGIETATIEMDSQIRDSNLRSNEDQLGKEKDIQEDKMKKENEIVVVSSQQNQQESRFLNNIQGTKQDEGPQILPECVEQYLGELENDVVNASVMEDLQQKQKKSETCNQILDLDQLSKQLQELQEGKQAENEDINSAKGEDQLAYQDEGVLVQSEEEEEVEMEEKGDDELTVNETNQEKLQEKGEDQGNESDQQMKKEQVEDQLVGHVNQNNQQIENEEEVYLNPQEKYSEGDDNSKLSKENATQLNQNDEMEKKTNDGDQINEEGDLDDTIKNNQSAEESKEFNLHQSPAASPRLSSQFQQKNTNIEIPKLKLSRINSNDKGSISKLEVQKYIKQLFNKCSMKVLASMGIEEAIEEDEIDQEDEDDDDDEGEEEAKEDQKFTQNYSLVESESDNQDGKSDEDKKEEKKEEKIDSQIINNEDD